MPKHQASGQGVLAIRLFGHTEMSVDGTPFKFATPRRSLHVLAYLLLNRTAPVTREYLAFLIYPDDDEVAARTKLRATLSDMPKILPPPFDRYVCVDGESVTWNPEAPLWLDVEAFAGASEDPGRLDEAIDLYRGDLLPQIYDEWIESARDRYRNAYVRCLSEAVSAARSRGDFGSAIETARKILAIDPWREDIVRRIIAMRYESGDRAGAISQYLAFSDRLRIEMNSSPMPETAALAERVQHGRELAGVGDAPPAPASGAAPVLPFVGRGAEIGKLLDVWNAAARGRGTFAFVGGETGIGKTRLAAEFAHLVEERGGRVLSGSTSFHEAVPYEAITDALRGALPLVAALKPDVSLASLTSLLPELRARVTLPDLPRLAAESERIRLFDAVCRAIGQLAAQRHVLLVLEDLHWAGSATHDMLHLLARRVAGTKAMVLITYRDDETQRSHPLQRLRNEATTALGATSLWLKRLNESDVADICATLGGERGRPAGELAAESHGNPHFLTQLVLDMREGPFETAPASLETLLERRIERLSSEARTAAEIAACIGDHFSRDALREVSAWDDTALSDALDELLDRRIVREAAGRGLFEYAFAHHAVREAVAGAVAPHRDAARRRRVARVLQELYPEHAPELSASIARHYDLGADGANAARSYLQAARHSIAVGALDEARAHCDRGVELATDLRLRCELLLERATVESRRGEPAQWDAALIELERAESELGDVGIHRAVLLQRFAYGRTCGDRAAKLRAAHELRASVVGEDHYWQAQAALAELRIAFDDDRLAEACAAGERALTHSRAIADHDTTARILCEMAVAEAQRGRLSTADELFRQTREAASHAADRAIGLLPLRSEFAVAHQRRDADRTVLLARKWLDLATQLADRPQQAKAYDMLGISMTATGKNLAEARRHFESASALVVENFPHQEYAASLSNRAILETRLGFFDRGLALTEKALESFTRAGNARGRTISLDNLVLLRSHAGDAEGARAAADEALALARSLELALNEASVLENLAAAEGAAGNLERALELAESSFAVRARSDSTVWSCKTLADAAIWHTRLGNVTAARDAVRRLLADEEAIVAGTDFPTYCYWAAAQVFHREGRAGEASRALERGRRLMQATADDLEGDDRSQYLAIRWNADLLRAAEAGDWPDPPR